jgi:hypothetical protein
LNSLRSGDCCPEFLDFFSALLGASPSAFYKIAQALTAPNPGLHPFFRATAEMAVMAEFGVMDVKDALLPRKRRRRKKKKSRSKAGMLLKTKGRLKIRSAKSPYRIENKPLTRESRKYIASAMQSIRYREIQTK